MIVDLYLTYDNSAEIAEYFGNIIIPKAAVINTISFIKVLSSKSENEANNCIRRLKIIEDTTEIESIKSEINKLDCMYRNIANKINKTIFNGLHPH